MYSEISSCILNNDWTSEPHMIVEKSIRQGHPLSALLLVISVEILLKKEI